MKTTSAGGSREPYVRGPHIRYFIISVMIALLTSLIFMAGIVSIMRTLFPF